MFSFTEIPYQLWGPWKNQWGYVTSIAQFDTDDIIDELERRGCDYNTKDVDGDWNREILEQIYTKRRMNQPFEAELDQLIWRVVGRIS